MSLVEISRNAFFVLLFSFTLNVHAQEVPSVTSVELRAQNADVGSLITYNEEQDNYNLSLKNTVVYGVLTERPPIVLLLSESSVPVVVRGVTNVLVTNENGSISRGDLLEPSSTPGVAKKAPVESEYVFAIALSGFEGERGLIMADIGLERAQGYQAEQQEILEAQRLISEAEYEALNLERVGLWRLIFAGSIVIGGIAFMLITARSLWQYALTAVGRNPRAQKAVWFIVIGGIIAMIIFGIFVLLIALAILVVPIFHEW